MLHELIRQGIPKEGKIRDEMNYELINKFDVYSRHRPGPKISFAILDYNRFDQSGWNRGFQCLRSLELVSATSEMYKYALELTESAKNEFGNYSALRLDIDYSVNVSSRLGDTSIYRNGPDIVQVCLITNLNETGYGDGVDMMYKVDSWGHKFLDIMAKVGFKPNWIATDYNFQGIESLRMTIHQKRKEDRWLTDENHPEFKAYLDKLVSKYSKDKE